MEIAGRRFQGSDGSIAAVIAIERFYLQRISYFTKGPAAIRHCMSFYMSEMAAVHW